MIFGDEKIHALTIWRGGGSSRSPSIGEADAVQLITPFGISQALKTKTDYQNQKWRLSARRVLVAGALFGNRLSAAGNPQLFGNCVRRLCG